MVLKEVLDWRYATKRMNGTTVPQEKIDNIVEAIRLTPTSLGFQPFHLFVVESAALRQTIFEKSCQQPQVIEGSHLLVLAARTEITDEEIEKYIHFVATTRGIPPVSLEGYKAMIASFKAKSPEQYLDWTARQTYIALGFGLIAAAAEQVDSTPIEGFDPHSLDELLGLKALGLHSSVLIALGYRDAANDKLATAVKVRKPISELVTVL